MGYQINVGDAIPTFRAMDQEGEVITDEDLLGTLQCCIFILRMTRQVVRKRLAHFAITYGA